MEGADSDADDGLVPAEELWTLAMERFLLGGACGVTVGCALYLAYYISSKQGTFSRPQRPGE